MDLRMMLEHVGGRERAEVEWQGLLSAAGFSLARILRIPDGHTTVSLDDLSVLEAVPA
jgi:hypothetical protein